MKDNLRKILLKHPKAQLCLNERVIHHARNTGNDCWRTCAVIESIIDEETANSEILLNFMETLLEQEKAKAEYYYLNTCLPPLLPLNN